MAESIIKIRRALKEDIATLLGFEQGIVEAERPFDPTLRIGEIHYYDLIELIRSERAEVLVALVEDEIVGSGYAKILPAKPYQEHTEYCYLGFMYVKPDFRGQGVNQQILQALLRWAKQQNLTEVRLEVYEQNTIAKNAYVKAGFTPHMLEMRLAI